MSSRVREVDSLLDDLDDVLGTNATHANTQTLLTSILCVILPLPYPCFHSACAHLGTLHSSSNWDLPTPWSISSYDNKIKQYSKSNLFPLLFMGALLGLMTDFTGGASTSMGISPLNINAIITLNIAGIVTFSIHGNMVRMQVLGQVVLGVCFPPLYVQVNSCSWLCPYISLTARTEPPRNPLLLVTTTTLSPFYIPENSA